MNNNKGYSLTELLLAIFVLSIVMLGIAGILRSTSQFYRNGVQEVRVQEEAQLAVNLIEEMLVDADTKPSFSADCLGDGSNICKLSFKDENGLDVNVKYYPETDANHPNQLTIDYDDSTPDDDEILADYVTGFAVDGIATSNTDPNADNKISVSVSMDNNGYEYTASKEIYTRNLVENPSISINTNPSSGGGGTTLWNYQVELNRYDSYNLLNWCYVDTTKPIKGVELVTSVDADGNTIESLVESSTFASYFAIDADGVTVRINAARTVVFNGSSPTNIGLKFTDKRDGLVKAIRFYYVPVKVDVSPNADFFVHYPTGLDINGQGYQTYVEVEGIDVNKAIASGDVSATAKMTLSDGSTSVSKDFTLSANQNGVNNGQQFLAQIDLGIEPDIQSDGIFIGARNGAQLGNYYGGQSGTLKVEIKLQPSSGSAYTNTLNYKFRIAGNVL